MGESYGCTEIDGGVWIMVHNIPHTKETKEKLSKIRVELWKTAEYRANIKKAREKSKKWKEWMKIFPILIQKYREENPSYAETHKQFMLEYSKLPEVKKRNREIMLRNWENPRFVERWWEGRKKIRGKNSPTKRPEVREKIADKLSGNNNPMKRPEVAKKVALKLIGNTNWKGALRKPNKLERQVYSILEEACPHFYTYNFGDYIVEFEDRRKVPDFIATNGEKKVIEVFGDFWHKEVEEQSLIKSYTKAGYDCLVIWEHEVKGSPPKKVIGKVRQFSEVT